MIVGIWRVGAIGELEMRPIEDLATLIHPDASVAWDRDCADVVLMDAIGDTKFKDLPALRFFKTGGIMWTAHTGRRGLPPIARWSVTLARWEPL